LHSQIIVITIAPIFFTACIYLCLSKIIPLYDPATQYAHFKPRTYTIIFISLDFLCLVLQAVGGALADTAATNAEEWDGVHIMIAGLSLQVASLLVFSVLCAYFAWRLRRAGVTSPEGWEGRTKSVLMTFIFGRFFEFTLSSTVFANSVSNRHLRGNFPYPRSILLPCRRA
jgi:hypothetical protein